MAWGPVVPLRLALYGHPDSGTFWEQHCEERLLLKGFRTIPGWPGVFTHEPFLVVLVVYVDDFKLAGDERDIEAAWRAISDAVNVGSLRKSVGTWDATTSSAI